MSKNLVQDQAAKLVEMALQNANTKRPSGHVAEAGRPRIIPPAEFFAATDPENKVNSSTAGTPGSANEPAGESTEPSDVELFRAAADVVIRYMSDVEVDPAQLAKAVDDIHEILSVVDVSLDTTAENIAKPE